MLAGSVESRALLAVSLDCAVLNCQLRVFDFRDCFRVQSYYYLWQLERRDANYLLSFFFVFLLVCHLRSKRV